MSAPGWQVSVISVDLGFGGPSFVAQEPSSSYFSGYLFRGMGQVSHIEAFVQKGSQGMFGVAIVSYFNVIVLLRRYWVHLDF